VAEELVRAVAELYEEHRRAAFPPRLKIDDANGVEMVGLDCRVAGCVGTWLENRGRVDNRRWDTLAECELLLNRAIPALNEAEAFYYRRLLTMTVLILEDRDDTQPR
jgi:hypothetical protein